MMGALAWIVSLPTKVKEYAVAAAVAIGIAITVFLRVKQMGIDEQKAKDAKADDTLDTKLDKIDANTLSVDDAIDRLRRRSRAPKR